MSNIEIADALCVCLSVRLRLLFPQYMKLRIFRDMRQRGVKLIVFCEKLRRLFAFFLKREHAFIVYSITRI